MGSLKKGRKGGGGHWWEEEGTGGVRLSEIIYKDGSAFAESEDGVFVQGGVGGEDAFGETLDHGAGEGEVLWGKEKKE